MAQREKRERERKQKLEEDTVTVGVNSEAKPSAKQVAERIKQMATAAIRKGAVKRKEMDQPDKEATPKKNQSKEKSAKKKSTPAVSKTKESNGNVKEYIPAVELKGGRKIPKPDDDSGCPHCGVHDLTRMSREDLKYYTKPGAWLHEKPCCDCDKSGTNSDTRVRDVKDVLKWKKINPDEMVRYCNYGAGAHGDENQDKRFTCDMVLCNPCHAKRVEELTSKTDTGNTNTRRSNRKRN